jgi:hypothetical protein
MKVKFGTVEQRGGAIAEGVDDDRQPAVGVVQ